MRDTRSTKRQFLRALAVLPAAGLLVPASVAAAQAKKAIVFRGVKANFLPGVDIHAWGWAAETPTGWTGLVVDCAISKATTDFPGAAAGTAAVVPRGTPNTINGFTNKEGIRATSVCFEEVTSASISRSTVKIQGKLVAAENPVIFKMGDPMSMEGNKDTGEFTYSLRGGGKDNVFQMKGVILTS